MRTIPLLAVFGLAASVAAQTVVLPASANGVVGTNSNAFPWGINSTVWPGMRVQAIYDSSHFTAQAVTAPILITNVKWRAAAGTTSWTGGVFSNATVALGTATIDHAAATTNFAANIGPDYTIVRSGAVNVLPGTGAGAGVPGPYVVDIVVNPPFLYDPNAGDLIVDVKYAIGSYAGGTLASMDVTNVSPLARRVFSSSNYPLANGVDASAPIIAVDWTPAPSGALAANASAGAGCIKVDDASFYELFPAMVGFDLANSGLTLLRSDDGYLALPLTSAFLPPSAAAQTLALNDNTVVNVALSAPLPVGRTATTTTLSVSSNGFITAGASTTTSGTPSASILLNNVRAFWAVNWRDMNPAIAGSGVVKFEQLGSLAVVTWDGVWDNAGTSPASANTFQAQFDLATGNVHYVYQSISQLANVRLVGFSDVGGSPNAGSIDISAQLPATFPAARFRRDPLTLTPTSRPVLGSNWGLLVTDVPAPGLLGVSIFGLTDPGIADLTILGLPGCGLRASLDVISPWFATGSTYAYSLSVPATPALLNVNLHTKAAVLQPGVNAFGAITSNGVAGRVGV
ncbi:MAG: hypothetical protein ACK56S_09755 [Planctomycetota bacterium]